MHQGCPWELGSVTGLLRPLSTPTRDQRGRVLVWLRRKPPLHQSLHSTGRGPGGCAESAPRTERLTSPAGGPPAARPQRPGWDIPYHIRQLGPASREAAALGFHLKGQWGRASPGAGGDRQRGPAGSRNKTASSCRAVQDRGPRERKGRHSPGKGVCGVLGGRGPPGARVDGRGWVLWACTAGLLGVATPAGTRVRLRAPFPPTSRSFLGTCQVGLQELTRCRAWPTALTHRRVVLCGQINN